jgi:hypothetical protein
MIDEGEPEVNLTNQPLITSPYPLPKIFLLKA